MKSIEILIVDNLNLTDVNATVFSKGEKYYSTEQRPVYDKTPDNKFPERE